MRFRSILLFVAWSAGAQPCRVDTPLVRLRGISEASSVAISRRNPGILWTANDSGEPVIFAVDPQGNIKARIRVSGAGIRDWEDLAVGPCPRGTCLYIADIGDNHDVRKNITVYRVPEPALTDSSTAPAEALHATYPDGPHDAEALFVTPDQHLYLVTKTQRVLYRYPESLEGPTAAVLERVAALDAARLKKVPRDLRITGASISHDGQWVALRTNKNAVFYRTQDLLSGRAPAFRTDLTGLREPQGEGIALGENGVVYLSGEGGSKARPGTLARLSCKFGGPF